MKSTKLREGATHSHPSWCRPPPCGQLWAGVPSEPAANRKAARQGRPSCTPGTGPGIEHPAGPGARPCPAPPSTWPAPPPDSRRTSADLASDLLSTRRGRKWVRESGCRPPVGTSNPTRTSRRPDWRSIRDAAVGLFSSALRLSSFGANSVGRQRETDEDDPVASTRQRSMRGSNAAVRRNRPTADSAAKITRLSSWPHTALSLLLTTICHSKSIHLRFHSAQNRSRAALATRKPGQGEGAFAKMFIGFFPVE